MMSVLWRAIRRLINTYDGFPRAAFYVKIIREDPRLQRNTVNVSLYYGDTSEWTCNYALVEVTRRFA